MANKEVLEAIRKELTSVFAVFAPMDKEYVQRIRAHHTVFLAKDKYNQSYIAQHRQDTKKGIKEMKLEYLDKAKAIIEQIKAKYTEQPKQPERPANDTAWQLQRSNNLTLWSAQIPVASVEELRNLYVQHKDDTDFMILLEVEFRKREKGAAVQLLRHEIENPVDSGNFVDLNKIEKALTFVCTGNNYSPRLIDGIENVRYRNVDADLAAFPVLQGATFRPIFDLPAM